MNSQEIRKRFLSFFEKRNHAILTSASLLTEDKIKETNGTLFNTAGMQPLVPFLMGKKHPKGKRLASAQKCVRTGDIEEIGDNTHATFFEMLGNWSLGDYFKKEAIQFSWNFLTDKEEGLGLDPHRFYITVFAGNDIVPRDIEAFTIWKQYVSENRIYFRGSKDNWWTAGPHSPAGPSTEIFYDLSGELGDLSFDEFESADKEQKLIEVWNDVFMVYAQEGGEIVGELPQKNVDTGAGLERITAIMQGTSTIFDTDLYQPLIDIIKSETQDYNDKHGRIIADHIKTAIFLIHDGVALSNVGKGYVLRRILRRTYQSMEEISCSQEIIPLLISAVVEMYKDLYFFNVDQRLIQLKIKIISTEMDKIIAILKHGKALFQSLKKKGVHALSAKFLMQLEQTRGIPLAFSKKLAKQYDISLEKHIDEDCEKIKKKHQALSRKGADKKFSGGLQKHTPKIKALHTSTHLMLAGLRKFLGENVYQKGSNITEERIRFDFNYQEKVPQRLLHQIEQYVNEALESKAKVGVELLRKKDAQESGVLGSFWEQYPDTVKVWTIIDAKGTIYSRELCGGPHVNNLSEVLRYGKFKITKEESVASGIRRIKAVLE